MGRARLRTVGLWGLGLLAILVATSLVQDLGSPRPAAVVADLPRAATVAPALPVTAQPPAAAQPTPIPWHPTTPADARWVLHDYSLRLLEFGWPDNLSQQQEEAVRLIWKLDTLSGILLQRVAAPRTETVQTIRSEPLLSEMVALASTVITLDPADSRNEAEDDRLVVRLTALNTAVEQLLADWPSSPS